MYIQNVCSISALGTINSSSPIVFNDNETSLLAIEPNYGPLIPPMQLRRMSKGLKMGIAAAKMCLEEQDVAQLSAISIGTAYGMLHDSEVFLSKMLSQNETMLNPTSFIQSTHNTVAGAIALSLGCNKHNMTFSHQGHSFESAVLDADLKLKEHPNQSVLLGAIDEQTETLKWLLGDCTKEEIGEGASFLLVSNAVDQSICKIKAYNMFRAADVQTAVSFFEKYLSAGSELIWNSYSDAQKLPMVDHKQIVNIHKHIGYNPTGSALALVFAINRFNHSAQPKIVINQFKDYWSVFVLER